MGIVDKLQTLWMRWKRRKNGVSNSGYHYS